MAYKPKCDQCFDTGIKDYVWVGVGKEPDKVYCGCEAALELLRKDNGIMLLSVTPKWMGETCGFPSVHFKLSEVAVPEGYELNKDAIIFDLRENVFKVLAKKQTWRDKPSML